MDKPIYAVIREYVVTNGLSQKVIASNMNITEAQISLLLNGKRRLTVEEYLSFCRAISVSPVKFLPVAE